MAGPSCRRCVLLPLLSEVRAPAPHLGNACCCPICRRCVLLSPAGGLFYPPISRRCVLLTLLQEERTAAIPSPARGQPPTELVPLSRKARLAFSNAIPALNMITFNWGGTGLFVELLQLSSYGVCHLNCISGIVYRFHCVNCCSFSMTLFN